MAEKLISEMLILPDKVPNGDFVLNPSKGVTEPQETLKLYVVTARPVLHLNHAPGSCVAPWPL
jgi:hypothetical protein